MIEFGERVLTKSENQALPGMMADARALSQQSASLVRGVLAASQLSALSTQAHIAAQTGSLSGRGNAATAQSSSPVHIANLHIHGVRDAQNVPGALAGAVLSQRQMARNVRTNANYGYEDD